MPLYSQHNIFYQILIKLNYNFVPFIGTTYLRFFLDVKMISSPISIDSINSEDELLRIRGLIRKYFPEETPCPAFPESLRRMVRERREQLSHPEIDVLLRFSTRSLKFLFMLYRKTRSFRYLQQKMSNLDAINDNLFRYKIIVA